MLFRSLCSGQIVPPKGLLSATSWLSWPRFAIDPVRCVPPSYGWNVLFGHQHPLCGLVGFHDSALVVEILWHQRSHRGDYCTRCIILATPEPCLSLFPLRSRCVTQRANGDLGTHAQSRQQDSEVKGTWLLCLGSNDCERAVMSVGFPGVILWHVIGPKLCRALPEASHRTCLWPGIVNHHLALLLQESDCCPSAFSEVRAKRLFVVHWVE